MAQHFLLSAQARTLSLKAIYQAGEDEAYETFCKLRWPETNGSPVCPRCECAKAYGLSTRRKFKCAACCHQFSVTSGTIFACRKLSFVDLLAAICLFVNAAKGASALQFSRDLDVQYKTAFVLVHKLREALAAETAELRLSNTVEVDGAYFGGHVRQANHKADRVDRRLLQHRTDKRRVVVVLRERSGRTLARSFRLESDGIAFARERIVEGSVVAADDVRHWDVLASSFTMERIDHSEAYSLDGTHTNLAESYFARLRRMIRGQHHRVEATKLDAYAAHAGWLEDHRRQSNGELADRLMRSVLEAPVSGTWSGYWQRAGVSPPAADQTQIPFRFSTMVTSLRRSAWRRDWTTLKTTELRSGVSDTSSLRSHMTRSASWRVSSSPSALKCRRQMSAISPFLKKPWLTMY